MTKIKTFFEELAALLGLLFFIAALYVGMLMYSATKLECSDVLDGALCDRTQEIDSNAG